MLYNKSLSFICFVYGKPHPASNLQVVFPGRNVVKGSEAIHSRILKECLVPSILDCKYFEAVSSSLTEADVVGDTAGLQ